MGEMELVEELVGLMEHGSAGKGDKESIILVILGPINVYGCQYSWEVY